MYSYTHNVLVHAQCTRIRTMYLYTHNVLVHAQCTHIRTMYSYTHNVLVHAQCTCTCAMYSYTHLIISECFCTNAMECTSTSSKNVRVNVLWMLSIYRYHVCNAMKQYMVLNDSVHTRDIALAFTTASDGECVCSSTNEMIVGFYQHC